MQQSYKGFTLIEIIVVMVIIGIVAAFAASRYINLTSSARLNSTQSIAASLAAASANNFAIRTASSSTGSAVDNCNDMGGLLPTGLPSGYTITSLTISAGASQTCTVTGPGSTTATFRGLGIS